MAYLDDHPSAIPQRRSPRRQELIGVIGLHTTEGVLDNQGADMGAENTAAYISRRTTYGSYHDIVDRDSIVHVVDYGDEAFHIATHGLNRRTTGLAFACRTTDWAKMSPGVRAAFLSNGAKAAAQQARYHHLRTGIVVLDRRITLDQALAKEPGFLAHGDADPDRRSDPGTLPHAPFPWDEFFHFYRFHAADLLGTTPEPEGFLMALTDDQQKEVYDLLKANDLKVTALEQRLARLEEAHTTGPQYRPDQARLPRLIASNTRIEEALGSNRPKDDGSA